MADNDIDLYADDIDQDFAQVSKQFITILPILFLYLMHETPNYPKTAFKTLLFMSVCHQSVVLMPAWLPPRRSQCSFQHHNYVNFLGRFRRR